METNREAGVTPGTLRRFARVHTNVNAAAEHRNRIVMLLQSTHWGQCVSDTHCGPDRAHLDTQVGQPQVLLPGSAGL